MTIIQMPHMEAAPVKLDPLQNLLPNALIEASMLGNVSAADIERLLVAAQLELDKLAPPVTDARLEVVGPGYAVVVPSTPGTYKPRVMIFKLSPLIACACGAVGTVLGGVTPVGWLLIGAVTAIGLRDFWSKKVAFEAEHGQILFEMHRSTDGGKPHELPRQHLLSNIQHSRAEAKLAPMEAATFDTVVSTLLATGALQRGKSEDTLRWTELSVEFDV